MQLTADVVANAPSYTNALYEKTISFRGLDVEEIENLQGTNDINECVDFTDNAILFLGDFPQLYKLKTLLIANNRIQHISDDIGSTLPNLERLSLTGNNLSTFQEIYKLRTLKHLKTLTLDKNPVNSSENYRLFVVHVLPQLEVLDFASVKQAERQQAKSLIGDNIAEFMKQQHGSVTTAPIQNAGSLKEQRQQQQQQNVVKKLSKEDQKRLKQQLLDATSLDEMAKIERQLTQGFW